MAIELVVPKLGESITEAVVAKWLKQVGDAVGVDEPVADLETDKVSVALPAPVAGVLAEQRVPAGATVKVGEVIGVVAPGAKAEAAKPEAAKPEKSGDGEKAARVNGPSAPQASAASVPQPSHPSPTMRKAIREGASVSASAGAIVSASAAQAPIAARAPAAAGDDAVEIVAMTPLRRRIAERLVEAQHTAAILTTFNEVDMSAVQSLRAKYQDAFVAKHQIKLGFMSFFARAVVESLKAYPGLNAEVRGNDIVYKKHYHLGIAVGSGRGLVVPVLRHVDRMSLAEIEHGVAALAQRAKDNKLTLDELQGGTFSITNGGIYGSMMSTPLLNMPQTGILGMHNIIKRPMAVGDQIALRPMMYLALSYDHRVVDGREAVQFLVGVKERIEAPERLMLDL
ncbi:MAG TPA: 2-oxoglutarate dehydrogenase complex dihydrolipoyllysine-residue succinyltransferase [Polyangia bacterium]|nr:2-oxoglutarate dehydrogenase complex dihydrolipoyllysine-residue succinyltransferase [Polyangia bacterium]